MSSHRIARFLASTILVGTPLCFGGVDRWVQMLGLGLMVVGFCFSAPRSEAMPPRLLLFLAVGLGWLLVKDWIPAAWVQAPHWRSVVVDDFQLDLGPFRHPEMIRWMESFGMLLLGGLWFWWIRSLINGRDVRGHFCWSILIGAFVVASVSLWVKSPDPEKIFNLRYTPAYLGFGPFPNRNHTASLLAMGLVMGAGVFLEMHRHRRAALVGVCGAMMIVIVCALFASGSRGALLAATVGGVFFVGCLFLRHRNYKIMALLAGGIVMSSSLFLVSGSKVLERVQESGMNVHTLAGRATIWSDAWLLIQDAPILGHGLDLFASVFPFYQRTVLVNHQVLHPESSWLLLLSEWGGIGVAILFGIAGALILPHFRRLSRVEHHFAYRAGAFSVLVVIGVHGLVDVPLHRWGTMVVALTALAIACPSWMHTEEKRSAGGRGWVLLPLALLAWMSARWWVPGFPSTPDEVDSLALKIRQNQPVPFASIERGLASLPLSGELHHYYGMGLIANEKTRERAWNHFRLANQLVISSWTMPYRQAVAAQPYSMAVACNFWTMAVERSGHRREEILNTALSRTAGSSEAALFWRQYVETNPELMLTYLLKVNPSDASERFQEWWKHRGSATGWQAGEYESFYHAVQRWGTVDQFWQWMESHRPRETQDYLSWARVLQSFGQSQRAWQLLLPHLSVSTLSRPLSENLGFIQSEWEQHPENWSNTQNLVLLLNARGNTEERDRVLLDAAQRPNSPAWFREAAARRFAEKGNYAAAVGMVLR